MRNYRHTLKLISKAIYIEEVIDYLCEYTNERVFWDDSRMWTLGFKPEYQTTQGIQRAYLGGGVRGQLRTNLTGALNKIFTAGILKIESIINSETEGLESWEQNTGVLLNENS